MSSDVKYETFDETQLSINDNSEQVKFCDGLKKVISSVISNQDAWPFMEPVDVLIAPMYYEVIEKPIDLSIIEKKVHQQVYTKLDEIERDFKLLVNNCETYNGPGNEYTLLSYAIWEVFKSSVKKFLNLDLNYDEHDTFIFSPKDSQTPHRTEKKRRRKRCKMKALEILAQAVEAAIKNTMVHSNSLDLIDNFDSIIIQKGKTDSRIPLISSRGNNLNIGITEENLTFKSLSEWSEIFKKSGNTVKLPQDSVILPPFGGFVSRNGNKERHFKLVTNAKSEIHATNGSITTTIKENYDVNYCPTNTFENNYSSRDAFTSSESSRDSSFTENESVNGFNFADVNDSIYSESNKPAKNSFTDDKFATESPISDGSSKDDTLLSVNPNRRLILKLSRCIGDSGVIWKPVNHEISY